MSDTRRKWFSMLASLTYPQNPAHAAEAFKTYLPMLTGISDLAFSQAALEEVVMNPRKMAIPSYDEVTRVLRSHRPVHAALPAPREPRRPPPTAEERAVVSALTRQALAEVQAGAPAAKPKDDTPVRSAYLGDSSLLALYEADAANGNTAAAIRAEALRAKLLRTMQREARQPEWVDA